MNKKKVLVYGFMVGVFALALFMLFKSNVPSFKGLSASVSPEEEKNIIMEAAKKYINDNITDYDGNSEIKIKDLIDNNYLVGDEINIVTNDLYDVDTRIFFKVANNSIKDIYMKSEMFRKLFKCDDVCYLEEDRYIYHENKLYKILKVDSNGNTYIVNTDTENVSINNIKNIVNNKYTNSNKGLVESIGLLSKTDIESTKLLEIENNTFVEASVGYKVFDIARNEIVDANENTNADIILVVKLKDTINYEIGDGTKFNPYVVSE